MKKLMLACAIMATAFLAQAEKPYANEQVISVTKGPQVAYTNLWDMDSKEYKQVEKITLRNDTAQTVTFVTSMVDAGITTVINTSVVTTGSSAVAYPRRSFTEAWSGFVVTGDVQVASSATTTKYEMYPAKYLRTIATLAGTNGIAAANALGFSVYAK